jgi:hypothetical protein
MKSILATALLFLTILTSGQDYKLFNATSQKVYSNFPVPDSTFSIAFDSVVLVGTDSVYYNFTQTGIMITSNNCQFWGGPECIKQDRPTWLGSGIIFNNASNYRFFNHAGETLNFDFSVSGEDSALFYESPTEKFYLTFDKSDTLSVLNYTDSARYYTVIHTDASGNSINSVLNGSRIIIAKTLGLIQFLQVDAFPEILNPVILIGNISPDLGLAKLTNEILYDHSVGDEIQIRDYLRYNFPSPDNHERFIKYTFLSKTVTTDSIVYLADRQVFDKESSTSANDVVVLKYLRREIITELPYDYLKPDYFFVNRKLYMNNYCGLRLWSYSVNQNRGLRYCSGENCWGSNDVPGPAPTEETLYTVGLGVFNNLYSDRTIVPEPTSGYTMSQSIIYFKKSGISCGGEAILGIDENKARGLRLTVYPNPANDFLTIETSAVEGCYITINSVNGQEMQKNELINAKTVIDIRKLTAGVYLIKLTSGNEALIKKFVKE